MTQGINGGWSNGLKLYMPTQQHVAEQNVKSKLRLFICEEQQILREAYQAFFIPQLDVDVIGSSGDTSAEHLESVATSLKPDVMLLGVKILQAAAVERLDKFRQVSSNTAIVLLSAYYDVKGIKALREFSRGAPAGCAYLLKHNIDTVEQLIQVVHSVSQGRIIVDPAVMEGLIATSDTKSAFLKDLTPREMEVLGWMTKGYRNGTIAEVMCLEPKTIERHINNIYSKVGSAPESKHPRVHAITLYLRATGLLPAEDFAED